MISLLILSLFLCSTQAGLVLNKDPIELENEVGKSFTKQNTEERLPGMDISKVLPEELEAYYYGFYSELENAETPVYGREGNVSMTSSCQHVRQVPPELRHPYSIRPRGISFFYQKYTETYNIPILGSARVSDDAVIRACYVLRFLLADREDLRQRFFKSYGRVAVMAVSESTTDVPEHAFLPQAYNERTRGLGAIAIAPVSTAGAENVLCFHNDTYRKEDILLREIAQGIQHLAARHVIPNFREKLHELYQSAISSGWWRSTYASLTPDAYFGEAVQSYFNVNSYGNYRRGSKSNNVNNRWKLRMYDPHLYLFIEQLWPCGNNYLQRCRSRGYEYLQELQMNCRPYPYDVL